MFDSSEKTELSTLGEFGLINHLKKQVKINHPTTKTSIGDDAAVINHEGKETVVTTDLLLEGVHFDLTYCPLKHLGYKAVVVNLSDIYAMNAMPTQITVSLGLSGKFSLEMVDELYGGILIACEKYGVDVVGGDTSSSLTGLTISITAIGVAEKDAVVLRSGANENDLLCVTGDIGAAYSGLQLLEREKAVFNQNPKLQPDLRGHDYVLERQLKPEAQKKAIEIFKEIGIKPTAMIDISDGLASEALHICHSSNVGCKIYDDKIPMDPTTLNALTELNIDPTIAYLNGGEDYELLFTLSQKDYEKIKENRHFRVIGHIADKSEGCQLITKNGSQITLTAQGWDAFLKRNEE